MMHLSFDGKRRADVCSVLLVVFVLSYAPVRAARNRFIEDFSTTQFRDPVPTTAL